MEDRMILLLYSEFSEETYRAGFRLLGRTTDDAIIDDFKIWVRKVLEKPPATESYEIEALPRLRQAVSEVLDDLSAREESPQPK